MGRLQTDYKAVLERNPNLIVALVVRPVERRG
jgi:hypothetical protein